jgi:hypothetical protein
MYSIRLSVVERAPLPLAYVVRIVDDNDVIRPRELAGIAQPAHAR